MRIVILGLKEQNRCCDDTSDKQRVNSVMKNVIGRNSQPRDQPDTEKDGQELLPQCNHAQVNDANGDVQHVHAGKSKESATELRHIRRPRISERRHAFVNKVGPFHAVQHDESCAEKHGSQNPVAGPTAVTAPRCQHPQHHGQRTGEQAGRHDGCVGDALLAERCGPARSRDSSVAVGKQQRSEGKSIGEQKQPHPNLFRIGAKQGRFVSARDPVLHRNVRHGFVLLDRVLSFAFT